MIASVQRRLREPRRPRLHAHPRLEPRRKFRLAYELPRARHANEPVAARRRFMLARQFLQHRRHQVLAHFFERLHGLVSLRVLNLGQDIPQFPRVQRLLEPRTTAIPVNFLVTSREPAVGLDNAHHRKVPARSRGSIPSAREKRLNILPSNSGSDPVARVCDLQNHTCARAGLAPPQVQRGDGGFNA